MRRCIYKVVNEKMRYDELSYHHNTNNKMNEFDERIKVTEYVPKLSMSAHLQIPPQRPKSFTGKRHGECIYRD